MSDKQSFSIEELATLIQTATTAAVQTAMAEARKPLPPTEKELAAIKEEQANRAQGAKDVRYIAEERLARKRLCSHTRRDGSTRTVLVDDSLGGYLLCQGCQDRIRPNLSDEQKKLDAPGTNYNTDLYNRLFQAAQPATFA